MLLGQPLGEIERRRAADIMREIAVHLALEGGVGLGLGIGLLQLEDQRHQRLGDEPPAEEAEMTALVRPGAEGIGLLDGHRRSCRGLLRHCRIASPRGRGAARAARIKARIFSGSLSPGARSTPDDTSTPGARVIRMASADIAGVEPAGQHERHAGIKVLQQVPVERLAETARPGRLARRPGVEQQAVGDLGISARSRRGRRAFRPRSPS